MSRIRSRDTAPEKLVRSRCTARATDSGCTAKDLPGRPDIVLPKYRTVVFVHGCFWHRHKGCRFAYTPKSRVAFWNDKFRSNIERDRRNSKALRKLGWRVLTVWECQATSPERWLSKL